MSFSGSFDPVTRLVAHVPIKFIVGALAAAFVRLPLWVKLGRSAKSAPMSGLPENGHEVGDPQRTKKCRAPEASPGRATGGRGRSPFAPPPTPRHSCPRRACAESRSRGHDDTLER